MGKSIVAINASPRVKWNTAQLVRAAADGAEDAGAQAEVINLYQLPVVFRLHDLEALRALRHQGRRDRDARQDRQG